MRDKASFTANAAAAARAYGAGVSDPRLRNPDALAPRFVGGLFRLLLLPGVRRGFLRGYEKRARGVFYLHQARTKYFDAVVRDEMAAGARQLVILGAGFDTRAYRFAGGAGVRAFEVDHPATSREKQKRVQRVLGRLPPHVEYVETDFVRDKLVDRLAAHRFDRSARTVFVWEGVTMYLDADAVDATLAVVGSTRSRSIITFDFLCHAALSDPSEETKKSIRYMAARGEPFTFTVDPAELSPLLAKRGIDLVEHLDGPALTERYLIGSDGKPWGTIVAAHGVARGRVR